VVPVARAYERADRAHGRRGDRGVPGGVLTASGRAARRAPGQGEQRRAGEALAAVHAALLAEGDLIAGALGPTPAADGALGEAAAAGPRWTGREGDIAFVIEAIREGELLHYGAPRLFAAIEPDLALLAGDRLYALGLARLAALGDLEAVGELADVIALCAQARAEGRPELAEAVWQAGVAAIGWGTSAALRDAKEAARAGEPGAAAALRAAARERTGRGA
jgi:hypothetical protein